MNEAIGYDAGKQIQGRKRFLAVETLGLVMMVFVTAASIPERAGAKTLLKQLKALSPPSIQRLITIWADGGFSGQKFLQWVMDTCPLSVTGSVAPQTDQRLPGVQKAVGGGAHLWVADALRRLVCDYEQLPETSETFIYIAMIRIMVRRLA